MRLPAEVIARIEALPQAQVQIRLTGDNFKYQRLLRMLFGRIAEPRGVDS